MRRLLFLLLLLFAAASVRASNNPYYFDYNADCAGAYRAYMALRLDEGDAFIRRELIRHPYNLCATYISDYGDCLLLLFNGRATDWEARASHQSERLERLSKANDDEPWKRLALAGVQLHWSLVQMRQGNQWKAAAGFRRSYLLLQENARRFPSFELDDALYGAEEALAGIIPDAYKWLADFLGMSGDFNRGLSRLEHFLRNHPQPDVAFREEALLLDVYIRYLYGPDKLSVWQQVSDNQEFPVAGNLMRSFVRGNLAISSRHADQALATLRAAKKLPGSNAWPVFDLELGSALLLRLDKDCIGYLQQYVARNEGKLFSKDALHQAALAAYLFGDKSRAEAFRRRIRTTGNALTDADKQAQRFSESEDWPDPRLLTARLLIDGGFASEALRRLKATSTEAFSPLSDRLEYEFRLGRALEETGDAAEAVQAYQWVINKGRMRPEYFAARSALQMAGIYESRRQYNEAKRYYQVALSMRNHDFQASIDQQAKAGLARLGN